MSIKVVASDALAGKIGQPSAQSTGSTCRAIASINAMRSRRDSTRAQTAAGNLSSLLTPLRPPTAME